MGVKYLWTVLTPFCDKKPLYELQGKRVAVDLSCWICEAQNIAEYQVQPRMYLRNLYFRTCYLLLMDVNPVFVLEGKAPELKYDTIAARNAVQFKGAKPKSDKVKTGKDRTRFHFILRQCEEMLSYMGLACIKGNGEAESLCASLNEDGLVDGCISQDSDCFAYGAQVVYRNFSISTQGAQAASGGAVDVYDIRKANQSLRFGRNKIIAMALLIGCDYSDGVHGVGKDSVLRFFETVSDDEVLDQLRSWRKNKNMYENYERQLADKNICTSCGHSGKIQGHTKNGCVDCKTSKGCDPFRYKNERLNMKNEVNMRNKAIEDPNFPDEILIREFLDRKDDVKQLDLTWKQPNVVQFLKFTTKFLQWEEVYSFEKILPILTRWQCRNPQLVKQKDKLRGVLKPDKIKKVRNPKGVPSYEIIWSDPDECFKGLIPESQILDHNVDMEKLWSTIEPQDLVEVAYPHLVEEFRLSKIKPKKVNKRRKKKNDNVNEIADKVTSVSVSEPEFKKTRKPRVRPTEKQLTIESTKEITEPCRDGAGSRLKLSAIENSKTKEALGTNISDLNASFKQMSLEQPIKATKAKTRTLDDFVKKAVTNSYQQKTSKICIDVHKNPDYNQKCPQDGASSATSSTPAKANIDASFDFDMSSFGDESDLELSQIVDDIVSQKNVKHNLKCIADQYVQGLDDSTAVVCLDGNDEVVRVENVDVKKNGKSGCGRSSDRSNELDLDNSQRDPDYDQNKDKNHISSFFVNYLADENDNFEKTFNETFRNFHDSGSDTEEYECDTNYSKGNKENTEDLGKVSNHLNDGHKERSLKEGRDTCLSSDDDSFDDNYVPLYERLKNK